MLTTEELADAIRLIQENIDDSERLWNDYQQKWEHDYQQETLSSYAMEELQKFRHSKAAHLRQLAIAKAELTGLKALVYD